MYEGQDIVIVGLGIGIEVLPSTSRTIDDTNVALTCIASQDAKSSIHGPEALVVIRILTVCKSPSVTILLSLSHLAIVSIIS